jgi:biotin transport system substrate-specific component
MAFVPGDLVKAVAASLVGVAVHKAYPVIDLPARRVTSA